MNIKNLRIVLVSCVLAFYGASIQAKTVTFSTFYGGTHVVQDSIFNINSSIFNYHFNIHGISPASAAPIIPSALSGLSGLISSSADAPALCYSASIFLIICNSGGSGTTLLETGGEGDGELPDTGGDGDNPILDSAAVPLPAAAWLLGSVLIGLFGAGRRKA